MSTCTIRPSARAVSALFRSNDPSMTDGVVNQLLNQVIERGYMTADEVDSASAYHLADVIAGMTVDSLDVDVSFRDRGAILVRSAEGFPNDGVRSRYATHYIGYGLKGKTLSMAEAYTKGGRPLVGNDTVVGADTVAVVEVTTSCDLLATLAACKRVVDAGGRLLLPSRSEVQQYASGIKTEKTREAYEGLHRELESYFVREGYSVRDSDEAGGRVVQKTGEVTLDRLTFAPSTKAGKLKAASDGLSDEQMAAKVSESKSWKISASSTFMGRDGKVLRAEGVKSATLYDAIVAGEVDSIAKSDTKNNAYSGLKSGDVLCLSKDSKRMVYVEVVEVAPNLTKGEYLDMLKSGKCTTGYSVESVAGMNQDSKLSVVKIKPIAERTVQPKEGGGKGKPAKDHKGKIPVPRKSRKGYWYTEWVYPSKAKDKGANGGVDNSKLIVDLAMAVLKAQSTDKTIMFDDGSGAKETTVAAAVAKLQDQYNKAQEPNRQEGAARNSQGQAAADELSKEIFDVRTKVNIEHRHSMQADVFGGSYALAEQFGKSLAGKFIELCEFAIIPRKMKQYRDAIEACRKQAESGVDSEGRRLSRPERNAMRQKMAALETYVASIEEDGWLTAVRNPNFTKAAVAEMLTVIKAAGRASMRLDKLRTKHPEMTLDELYKQYEEDYESRIDPFMLDMIDYDQRKDGRKFLGAILDGYLDYTDAEWRAEVEEDGDTDTLEELDSRSEEELREAEAEDAEIMRRRGMADILRADAVRLMIKEVSDIVGVKLSYDIRVRSHDAEEDYREDMYTIDSALAEVEGLRSDAAESEEDAEASDEANDAEAAETSEKDIQMTASYERDISDSLSKEVKRILGTQYEWWVKTTPLTGTAAENNTRARRLENDPDIVIVRDENGDAVTVKKFHVVRDGVFRSPKRIAAGLVYNNLLNLVNGLSGVKGLYSGEELYQYLSAKEEFLPWAHGLVLAMRKDPGVKSAIWVAMRQAHINMRAMRQTSMFRNRKLHMEWASVSENYGNLEATADAVVGMAQSHVTNGVVLNRGEVTRDGKPVRISVSRKNGRPGNVTYYN